jgi:inositol-phosphate phosphatase/L-galactose 1-phosphate phosphatase/histidinol-phosphatase
LADLDIHKLARFAASLADAARPIIHRYFRAGVAVDMKDEDQPVTRADREAEAAMRLLIAERFPDHGIAGEEYGLERGDAETIWSLDPIDGTKAFITNRPMFGTLIGVVHRSEPTLGVIDMPVLDQRFVGGKGYMARMNGSPIRSRECADLAKAFLVCTSPTMFEGGDIERFARVRDGVALPLFAGDCYNYAQVACGDVDICIESGLKDYDYLAAIPVIEAAGGVLTDWNGDRPGLAHEGRGTDRVIASGDARTHARALELLAG